MVEFSKKFVASMYTYLRIILVIIFSLSSVSLFNVYAMDKTNSPGDNTINYMILVNKNCKLPEDWGNRISLKSAKNIYGEKYQVEEKTLKQFELMRKDLLEEGIDIELDSTLRTVNEQQELWNDWIVEHGEEYVHKYMAAPGYSEHHTGLAIDICLHKDGKRINNNEEMIAEKKTFEKIQKNLSRYGFILRYPENKKSITGYGYEPWHFRYIDNTTIAKIIMDNGMTLEECLKIVECLKIMDYKH